MITLSQHSMRAGRRLHTCSGTGEGVEWLRGWLRDIITEVSCRGCKGQRQCQVVEKLTPHMRGKGRTVGQYTYRVQLTSRRLGLPMEGTHGSCPVHRVNGCACTRFVSQKNIATVGKGKVTSKPVRDSPDTFVGRAYSIPGTSLVI